jgi:hypothetical protein
MHAAGYVFFCSADLHEALSLANTVAGWCWWVGCGLLAWDRVRGGDIARLLLLMRQCIGALIRPIGIAYADLGWSTVLRHATHSLHLVCLLGCIFNGADFA